MNKIITSGKIFVASTTLLISGLASGTEPLSVQQLQNDYDKNCKPSSLLQQIFRPNEANYIGSKYNHCSENMSRQAAAQYRDLEIQYRTDSKILSDHEYRSSNALMENLAEHSSDLGIPAMTGAFQETILPAKTDAEEYSSDILGNTIIQSK